MCIVFFALGCHPRHKLILLSNRDEFYDRPTALAHFWDDDSNILVRDYSVPPLLSNKNYLLAIPDNHVDPRPQWEWKQFKDNSFRNASCYFIHHLTLPKAGRDLQRHGTWLGVTKKGRFAAVTNYRVAFAEVNTNKKSRGALIPSFLQSESSAEEWMKREVLDHAEDYDYFNIIVRDEKGQMVYYCNKNKEHNVLEPGKVYAVSNRLLDTEWPKVVNGKQQLQEVLDELMGKAEKEVEHETAEEKREQTEEGMRDLSEELHENLFKILKDHTVYPDDQLPDTGVGIEWERLLCPIFVNSDTYGTRASTLILIDSEDKMTFVERSRTPDKEGKTSPSAPIVESVFRIDLKKEMAYESQCAAGGEEPSSKSPPANIEGSTATTST
jgi:uncharacterized protein with NRDE domain